MGSKGKGGRFRMPAVPQVRQLEQLQSQLLAAQEALAVETVTATVGGGAVSVTMTGHQEVRAVKLDPQILSPEDAEMIEDLLVAAYNEALQQSRKLVESRMAPLTGGLNIPGLL
ncbi:MAG: YbaB/EbfC family nucleoid-associated protein [Anaerolineae bacterium]|nr:YbaB/EbfC family nucleoid-associated protein [Anaerolineae bacterium]